MFTRHNQRGVSLIELIIFIVIVSIALTGILAVMNITNRTSADPVVHKQALAIAESLLEEVELMPFTICDPDDANAANATAPAQCTAVGGVGGPESMGPDTDARGTETRYAAGLQFDNVNDYHNFQMTGVGGIKDITGTPISSSLDGYTAKVTVAATAFGGITAASGDALLITVTVTGQDNVPIVLEGYRTRYAPRTPPP